MTCRIAAVETFLASYPICGEFKYLVGPRARTRDTVLVRITDDSGNEGWGQSVPSHRWSYETIETVRSTIDGYLGPALIGLDPFDQAGISRILSQAIAPSFSTGQPICKAGLELALCDLTGRICGESAITRWSQSGRDHVTLSWTIDVKVLSEVEGSIAEASRRGFRNFNLKVGANPQFDVEVASEVRRLAADAFIWADANGGYDLEAAKLVIHAFADSAIAALEQPFPANRLSWYAEFRKHSPLPILMDEGIVSLVDLIEFHQLELLDGVAMKVARCGGLTEAVRMAEYLADNGLLMYASGLTDPDVSLAASLLLFGAFGLEYPAALNAPQFLQGSVLRTPLTIVGDQASVPRGAGLGVEVDESLCEDGCIMPR